MTLKPPVEIEDVQKPRLVKMLQKQISRIQIDSGKGFVFPDGKFYGTGDYHDVKARHAIVGARVDDHHLGWRHVFLGICGVCRVGSMGGTYYLEADGKLTAKQEARIKDWIEMERIDADDMVVDLHDDPDEQWLKRRLFGTGGI